MDWKRLGIIIALFVIPYSMIYIANSYSALAGRIVGGTIISVFVVVIAYLLYDVLK